MVLVSPCTAHRACEPDSGTHLYLAAAVIHHSFWLASKIAFEPCIGQTDTHRETHRRTDAQTQTHRHADIRAHARARTHTHAHSDIQRERERERERERGKPA